MPLSDRELVERICAGSEADFNVLYDRYFQKVYNFTFQRIRNQAETEELVQETFTSVFTSLKSYEGRSSLLSWIYGIMKNNINNHFRRKRLLTVSLDERESASPGLERASPDYLPDQDLEMKEMVERFDRALQSLTKTQYLVFRMRHLENLSIEEIAQRTSKSKDSVKSNLYRIKRVLTQSGETEKINLAWL